MNNRKWTLICLFSLLSIGNFANSGPKAFGRLIITHPDTSKSYCDATVVGKKHILTSASCFEQANLERGLVEFIPGYKGTNAVNPPRYVVSKAWIPSSYERADARGHIKGKIQSNFALLEAHNVTTGEWVGEEVEAFSVSDRYDFQELQDNDRHIIQTVSFQNSDNHNKIEVKGCEAEFDDMTDGSVHNTTCNYWNYAVGSPVLEKVGAFYTITSILSGTKRSTGNSIVTRFGRFINPIKDVIAGRAQSEFDSKDVNWKGSYQVVIQNDCPRARDLKVHFVYKDIFTDEWKMESTTQAIKPGEAFSLNARTKNTVAFFRAESGDRTWTANDGHYNVGGVRKSFKRVQMKHDPDAPYKDEKMVLTCD